MALTGLTIFKLLPKTNCGECGVPTCMAFAMKLAAKNAELAACPYASEEAKKTIGAASKPPIRLVKIGPAGAEVAVAVDRATEEAKAGPPPGEDLLMKDVWAEGGASWRN